MLQLQITEWETIESFEEYVRGKKAAIEELNRLTNIKIFVCSKQLQFIVKWWHMKDVQNILQLATSLNASANCKRLRFAFYIQLYDSLH